MAVPGPKQVGDRQFTGMFARWVCTAARRANDKQQSLGGFVRVNGALARTS
jgi:hypothetical protein